MTIELSPSTDTNALTDAIKRATSTNQPLVLLPGVHFTKPGQLLHIPIGPNGLKLSGSVEAQIKRPDNSIGKLGPDNPNGKTDDNYGISLVPAPPTHGEVKQAQWQRHQPPKSDPFPEGKPFEYVIIMRGKVSISGVTVDCNMGKQVDFRLLEQKDYVHSAMLRLAGARYKIGVSPEGLDRFAFVGFVAVELANLTLLSGGFSDDIAFPDIGFRPNISQVRLSGLVSRNRLSPIRATVGFSGLGQLVSIRDCKIDNLHCEVDSPWTKLPGPPGLPVEQSSWVVHQVRADNIAFTVKDKALTLDGSQLNVANQFELNEAAGSITDSRLVVSLTHRRLIGLRDFHFRGCNWVLRPDASKNVPGLVLLSKPRHPFKADFTQNTFLVEGKFENGQLIATPNDAGNTTAKFTACKYQAGFGTAARPIASLSQHGKYSFREIDLAGLVVKQAIKVPPKTVQTKVGGFLVFSVPKRLE